MCPAKERTVGAYECACPNRDQAGIQEGGIEVDIHPLSKSGGVNRMSRIHSDSEDWDYLRFVP